MPIGCDFSPSTTRSRTLRSTGLWKTSARLWPAKCVVRYAVLTDVLLVVVFAAAILLGALRGSVRQLLALGGWLVTVIMAADLRAPVAEALTSQFPNVSEDHAHMAAFVLAFLVLFGIALVAVQATGIKVQLTMRPYVDEAVGGAVMLLVAVLAVASVLIALDTYYIGAPPGEPQIGLADALHDALQPSAIAAFLREKVNPVVLGLLSPFLPADVRAAG